MSKNMKRKTLHEILYENGLGSLLARRPVMMEPLVRRAGFVSVERTYRENRFSPKNAIRNLLLSSVTGAEIILASKPLYGR